MNGPIPKKNTFKVCCISDLHDRFITFRRSSVRSSHIFGIASSHNCTGPETCIHTKTIRQFAGQCNACKYGIGARTSKNGCVGFTRCNASVSAEPASEVQAALENASAVAIGRSLVGAVMTAQGNAPVIALIGWSNDVCDLPSSQGRTSNALESARNGGGHALELDPPASLGKASNDADDPPCSDSHRSGIISNRLVWRLASNMTPSGISIFSWSAIWCRALSAWTRWS